MKLEPGDTVSAHGSLGPAALPARADWAAKEAAESQAASKPEEPPAEVPEPQPVEDEDLIPHEPALDADDPHAATDIGDSTGPSAKPKPHGKASKKK